MKKNILNIAKTVFDDEVDALMELRELIDESFVDIVNAIDKCKGRVILSGIGKSGHIARKISATLSSTGTSSFFMHSTEAFHGDLGMLRNEDIVIAISYSGETEEVIKTVSTVKKIGCKIIGVSGKIDSSLAKLSDFHQNIRIKKEACPLDLAPTSSTTATLVWGDALAISLMEKRNFKPEDFAKSHPGGSLGKRLLLLADDVMIKGDDIPRNASTDNAKDILNEITQKGVGATFIFSENDKLQGIITDGDIRRCIESNDNFLSLTASEMMKKDLISIDKNELAYDCLQLMIQKKIGCLAVLEKGSFCGVINQKSLLSIGL